MSDRLDLTSPAFTATTETVDDRPAPCTMCGKNMKDDRSAHVRVLVHIRGAALDSQTVTGFCSEACREAWWNDGSSPFISESTRVDKDGVDNPQLRVEVWHQERFGGNRQPRFAAEFENAAALNEWWQTPESFPTKLVEHSSAKGGDLITAGRRRMPAKETR